MHNLMLVVNGLKWLKAIPVVVAEKSGWVAEYSPGLQTASQFKKLKRIEAENAFVKNLTYYKQSLILNLID